MDTEATWELYETITSRFTEQKYDWTIDFNFWFPLVKEIVKAQIRGVVVNKDKLINNIRTINKEIEDIDLAFSIFMQPELLQWYKTKAKDAKQEVIDMLERKLARVKLEKTKVKTEQELLQVIGEDEDKFLYEDVKFNISSKKHLEELFVDILGINIGKTTPTGKPSFKAAHIGLYGEGGKLLEKRGKALLNRVQMEKLLELSLSDGLWHLSLKTTGTTTGRFSGGGGLNAQGLSRRYEPLMGILEPKEGNVFISNDLAAGEPTVTSHYSKDENYRYATIDGLGKEPYWRNGVLYIADIYLMFGSVVQPELIKEHWDKGITDPDKLKDLLKKPRQLWKITVLGLSYGMSPNKLALTLKEQANMEITNEEAFEYWKKYWGLFKKVREFSKLCTVKSQEDGFIVNEFGYRLTNPPHKAFNAVIQSTVNGLMSIFIQSIINKSSYVKFITVIHDEIIWEIPKDKVEDFKNICGNAEVEMNNYLNWSVNVRTGFVSGNNLFEAK
jgi:DNA polymerase I-like protein with 3'-5' exonuclease and polymerase domains